MVVSPAKKSVFSRIKQLTAYKKGLLIYILVLLLLFVGSQIVIWTFLSSYQNGLSEHYAKNYIADIDEKGWKSILNEELYGSEFQAIETDVDLAYAAYFKGKSLTCRRSPTESKGGVDVFKVKNDELMLCTLTVEKNGSGAYNMPRWSVLELSLDKALLDTVNPEVTLYAPCNSKVSINGVSVAGDRFKACLSPFVTEFEKEENKAFSSFTYRAPFGEYKALAELNGTALKQHEVEENAIGFNADSSTTDVVITVPSGAEIYVNDIRVSTKYITGKSISYPFLNPLEKECEGIPFSTEYTIKSFYSLPEVKVLYNGDELKRFEGADPNKFEYAFNSGTADYVLSVPKDALVFVNGVDVSGNEQYITDTDIEYSEVSEYKNELANPRVCCVYTFKGMFFKPNFSVKDAEGNEYELVNYDKNSYRCDLAPNAAAIPQYEELAKGFAEAMMEYTFMGRENLNANFNNVLSKTRLRSKAYDVVMGSYAGMYWRRDHTIVYNSLYVDNYVGYADNAFRCDVHYDVTGTRVNGGKVERVAGIYRLLYINNGGRWEVVELNLLNKAE